MAMKSILLLLSALLIACYRDGSAPPNVLSAKDESRDSRSAFGSVDARQSDWATSESAPQTQKVDLWDPNDGLHVADRMLERVKQEGVVRIAGIRASGNRYVFVGEFTETWQLVPTQAPRPKTDLWLVNKDGTGLRRLTEDGESYDPEWSPSGDEIAFVSRGSVNALNVERNDPAASGGVRLDFVDMCYLSPIKIMVGRERGITNRALAKGLGIDASAVTGRVEAARARGAESSEVVKLRKALGLKARS